MTLCLRGKTITLPANLTVTMATGSSVVAAWSSCACLLSLKSSICSCNSDNLAFNVPCESKKKNQTKQWSDLKYIYFSKHRGLVSQKGLRPVVDRPVLPFEFLMTPILKTNLCS